jgi:hypothetical protein
MPGTLKRILLCITVLSLAACAAPAKRDYTAYRQCKPHSILVLPPLNNSPDVRATYSVLSTVTMPLAEAGYYVFPVALVDQTFKENGMSNPGEMHQAPLAKIREVFGADSVLYITVMKYGSSYQLLSSDVIVTVNAKLIDARNGQLLWEGTASASDAEGRNNQGGLAAVLITAVIKQVVNNVAGDGQNHNVARIASTRLLTAQPNGLLYGPRSPMYEKDN